MKLIPSKTKETIESGVGRFATKTLRAMHPDEAMQFLGAYCVFPELYQDICNAVNHAIENEKRRDKYFVYVRDDRVPYFSVHCSMVASHKVIKVTITRHLPAPPSRFKWASYEHQSKVADIFLRITNDGLIADICDRNEVPKYNPANLITILDRSEASYH
jgi:hypothetical protein